jgi:hypothetical protein
MSTNRSCTRCGKTIWVPSRCRPCLAKDSKEKYEREKQKKSVNGGAQKARISPPIPILGPPGCLFRAPLT